MSNRLSDYEIQQRLLRLTNLERLHGEQRERNQRLEAQVQELTQENKVLREQNETLLIRLAELETTIFGKKRNKDSDSDQSSSSHTDSKEPKKQRPKDSYQRSVPADEEVTDTEHHTVDVCMHCKGELSRFENVVRYVEDIILPQLLKKATKTITKHIIERGYCAKCGNWTSALPLRGSIVSLGKNIRLLVTYLTTILDCSYEQVKTLTNDLYSIQISDGEIVNILQEQSIQYLPEYERLKQEIREGIGVHMDETTWPIQAFGRHCYAWVMSAVSSPIRIYKLAISRGKDHATQLMGNFQGVRITDCFPGYKNMAGLHQICWAHLLRKIRDLLENKNLPEEKLPYVEKWYEDFSATYKELREYLAEPFTKEIREQQTTKLRTRIHELRSPNPQDPKKLRDLKNLITEYDHALFTCMQFEGIPCDNNRAERDLRSLVIKRKKSFGSRTESGARAMEILLSVAWSTWHMNRSNFLQALSGIQEKHQKA